MWSPDKGTKIKGQTKKYQEISETTKEIGGPGWLHVIEARAFLQNVLDCVFLYFIQHECLLCKEYLDNQPDFYHTLH